MYYCCCWITRFSTENSHSGPFLCKILCFLLTCAVQTVFSADHLWDCWIRSHRVCSYCFFSWKPICHLIEWLPKQCPTMCSFMHDWTVSYKFLSNQTRHCTILMLFKGMFDWKISMANYTATFNLVFIFCDILIRRSGGYLLNPYIEDRWSSC